MDWSLVKFLCHFLLLPSTLAPALLSSRRRSLVLAPGSLLFGEDVSKHGNTPRSPLSHRLPAAVPTGSAPGQAEQLNGKTTFFFSQQLSDTFFFFLLSPGSWEFNAARVKAAFFSRKLSSPGGRSWWLWWSQWGWMGAEVGSQGLGMRSPSVAMRERGVGLWRGERSASARAHIGALLQTLMARCEREKKRRNKPGCGEASGGR